MARNTDPFFYLTADEISIGLTTSAQTIATGGTNDSEVTSLYAVNTSAVARTLTFYDTNDVVIQVVNLPANAGNTTTARALNCLQPGLGPKVQPNPYGGYVIFLKATKVIKAKVDSGTACSLVGEIQHY